MSHVNAASIGDAQRSDDLYGVLAEFADEHSLLAAAARVRDAGYRRWDAFTPYPVHGLDDAMGVRGTRLPWLVLVCGLTGMTVGILLCWWTNATSFNVPSALRGYPLLVSGKPLFSLPANIPVIFELTILFSAFAAVFGMLGRNGLPRLYHPLFRTTRFRRASRDRFFIAIEADDAAFDPAGTIELLRDGGAVGIEQVRDA
jgi:hypothetical protein